MKKQITVLAALFISVASFAQSSPTHEHATQDISAIAQKKDTVYVPLVEKDTLIAATLTYKGFGKQIMYENGYVKLKGFVKAGTDQFVSQPQFVGYLNHRKKAFKKKVIQAF